MSFWWDLAMRLGVCGVLAVGLVNAKDGSQLASVVVLVVAICVVHSLMAWREVCQQESLLRKMLSDERLAFRQMVEERNACRDQWFAWRERALMLEKVRVTQNDPELKN